MPPKVKYPEYVALRLEKEMADRLRKMADAEDRTVGSMIRIILREGLVARGGKPPKKKTP